MLRTLLKSASLLLCAACATAPVHAASPPPAQPAASNPPSAVELIDAGAAPRDTLRYRFDVGRSERAALDTNLQMSVSIAGQLLPMTAVPPVRMVMSLRTTQLAADGAARIQFEMVSAESGSADPAQAEQVKQAMAGAQGLSGWYRLDQRGLVSEGGLDAAANSSAGQGPTDMLGNFREAMQQFAAPLPAEAVGVGARWRIRQNISTGGMQVSQTAEYTLRARTGRKLELVLSIVDSKIEAAGALPAGAQIESVNIEGGGSSLLDLDRLVPTANIDVATRVALSSAALGQGQAMALELKLKQTVAPIVD